MKDRSISMRPDNRGRGVRQERQTDPVPVSEKLVNTVIAGTSTLEEQGWVYLAALTDPYLRERLVPVHPEVHSAVVTSNHATGKDREVTQMARYHPEDDTLRGACHDYPAGIAGGGLLPVGESQAILLMLPTTPSVDSTDRALSDGVHKDSLASHSVTFVCQECAQGDGLQPDVDFNDAFTNEEPGLTVPVLEQRRERIMPFSSPCSMIIEED